MATSAGTLIVSVAVGVAVWKVASGIQWALVILASGSALQMTIVGIGVAIRHMRLGKAEVIAAEGEARSKQKLAEATLVRARHRSSRP